MAYKEEKGNFGKSKYSGNKIKRKITITRSRRGSSKSSKSSKSKSRSKSKKLTSAQKKRIAEEETRKAIARSIAVAQSGVFSRKPSKSKKRGSSRTVQQNGTIYNVKANGSFERVGFTKKEQARRERVKSGTARARDIYSGLDTKTESGRRRVIQRLQPRLRQQERELAQKQRRSQEVGRAFLASASQQARNQQQGRAFLSKPENITVTQIVNKYKENPKLSISNILRTYQNETGVKVSKKVADRARNKLDKLKRNAESQIKKMREKAKETQSTKKKPFETSLAPINAIKNILLGKPTAKDKLLLLEIGSFGLGAASTFVSVGKGVTQPVSTIKGFGSFTASFIKNPIKVGTATVKGVKEQFILNPSYTLGEFFTFGKVFSGVAGATRKSAFGRAVAKEIYILKLPKELQKPTRTLLNAAESQRLINPIPKNTLKKASFFDVKELTVLEAKALAKTLKQTDSVVFGTASARVLSRGKTRTPSDVDFATAKPKDFVKKFVANLPKAQRRNYKLKGAKIFRNGKDIMDIKDFSKLYPQKSIFTKKGQLPVSGYVLKFDRTKGSYLPTLKRKGIANAFDIETSPVVKVKGINFAGFGEQTTRKTLGTIQVLVEKNIKRKKDVADLLQALKVQLKSLEKSKTKNPLTKIRNKRAIKNIKAAIKLIQSKNFKKLIAEKLKSPSKKKATKKAKKRATKKKTTKRKTTKKKVTKKKVSRAKKTKEKPKKKQSKSKKSKLPKSKLPKSRLPKSRLPKSRLAKSRVPKSRLAKSKLAKSRVPKSRLPKSKLAKSRVPKSRLAKSKLAKSRVPKSRLAKSKLAKSRLGAARKAPIKERPIKRVSKKEEPQDVKNPTGYDVYIKKGALYKRLNKRAYTKAGASAFGRWLVNNSTARTFLVVGVKKKATKLPKYVRKTPKKLFRQPKKRSKLKNKTVVERSRYLINTRGEKKGLRASALLKRVSKPQKRKKRAQKAMKRPLKRKITRKKVKKRKK